MSLTKLEKKNPRLKFFKKFDEELSHKLYAAGDIFVMPSLYEPCGLSQMYALRYGTIPVVSSTGGLDDTIDDINNNSDKGELQINRWGDIDADKKTLQTGVENIFAAGDGVTGPATLI